MWGEIIRYDEVTSTNDLARDHARRGVAEGSVVVARYQAAGRGRQGRAWCAPRDRALLCSLILRPPAALARSAWLTLLGGLAVAEAVRQRTQVPATLKWPNDVLVEGRKLAGVLTETSRVGETQVAVVGIGLNVNQEASDFAGELAESATSLQLATGKPWPADELLNDVVEHYRAGYQVLLEGGVEKLRQQYLALDSTVGRAVQVEAPDGAWSGRAATVDEHGALWVEDAAGDARKIIVGDISIRVEA